MIAAIAFEKQLATMFDLLIRNTRGQSGAAAAVAPRLLEIWRTRATAKLEFSVDGVTVDGKPVVDADATFATWLLPIAMAGLRSVQITEITESSNVFALASEIGRLAGSVSSKSIQQFADWLFEDGAEGIVVEVHSSYVEGGESDVDRGVTELIAAVRGESFSAVGEVAYAATAADLDAAATRAELNVPFDAYVDSFDARAHELSRADFATLRDGISKDVDGWARAELRAVVNSPELLANFPPQRIVARIVDRMNLRSTGSMLSVAKQLEAHAQFGKAYTAAVDDQNLAGALATHVGMTDLAFLEEAIEFAVLGPERAKKFVVAFLERADLSVAALRVVSNRIGAAPLVAMACKGSNFANLELFIQLVEPEAESAALVKQLLAAAPPAAALRVVRAWSPAQRATWHKACADLLPRLSHTEVCAAAGLYAASRDLTLAFLPMFKRKAAMDAWSDAELGKFCGDLFSRLEVREELVNLAQDWKYDMRLRLVALEVASRMPELGLRAAAFSLRAWMFDRPDIQNTFKAARARLGAGK